MRKAFLLSAVAAVALFAQSVKADVFVFGTVHKDQFIFVDETIFKQKVLDLDVVITTTPEKYAESATHFNQRNDRNRACENCAEKQDLISGSVIGNAGITNVNQSSGNNNNQATVISFAFDAPIPPPPDPGDPGTPPAVFGFAESQVAGSQHITRNTVETINIVFRDALITGSINSNTGITGANQASGNINNQANAISIAVSGNPGVSLSDAALGQFVTGNFHSESDVSKQATTIGSINLNSGITQVNQSAGNLGNQSNVVSIAVTGF